MRTLTKPVWTEGMYLGPHHFQNQIRYFEDALDFVVQSLWRDAAGFAGFEFDGDALRNGTMALVHARGLFSDGLAFDIPGSDPAPAPRPFAGLFSPVADHLTMYLAVPALVRGGRNTSPEEAPAATRFTGSKQLVPDHNTGLDEKHVETGRKNLQVVAESELNDSLISLALVRILRDGSGHFEVDPAFVPPCLNLHASPALAGMLSRLVDILTEKSTVFTQEQANRSGVFQAGMSARDVGQYWFLHTLNCSIPALRNLLVSQHSHPQELYREMARLGGALCTFGLETHPQTLPAYNHLNASECFATLDLHIRRHLELVMPSKAIRIALNPVESCLWNGQVSDERCLGAGRWILEIQSPIGDAALIANAPRLNKICSARFVVELIKRALPGLKLTHLPVPPPQIAARVECQYFSIERVGPCWEHIVQTRMVGVYVPAEIPAPQMSILVLRDD